jgi:DNA-binding CsgD family transcriptional regulator
MESMLASDGRVGDRPGNQFQGPLTILVGRTEEQASLRDLLAVATAGHGQLCLLGGEAGIGKTTLARDLARTAAERGVRVLTGSCYDLASSPPYGPWLDLFEACRRDPSLPPPPVAFTGGQLAPIADQAALFADVRRFVAELAADRPALVILEDLHWADPASLDLLRHVGPHLRHWPVLLLITYRVDELAPGRPLTQHLPALVREADGHRFDLHRLDVGAVRALLATQYRLARADEDRLLAHLERHAEGNPFFATEILRALEGNGVLHPAGSSWALGAFDRLVVPTLLRQVIDGRIVRLGEETRKPLAIASVIGHEVPLALWAEVAALTGEDLLDIVERAVEAHLLEAEQDGTRVRFVHALIREALYEGILPPRRNAWHLKTAEALTAAPRPDPDAVAFHLREAGDPRAVGWLIQAGERAQRAYAWLTAAERFRVAVALLEGREREEHVRRRLLIRIFYLLRFAYPAGAIAAMDEALRLARRAGDTFTAAETRGLRGLLLCYSDQYRVGLAEMERGIGAIEGLSRKEQHTSNAIRDWLNQVFTGQAQGDPADDEAALERLNAAGIDYRRSYHAWMLASAGHLAEAAAVSDRFVEISGTGAEARGGIRLAIAFAHHALAIVRTAHGQPGAARAHWARARVGFQEVNHHVVVAFALLDELRDIAIPYGAGEPAARRRLAAEAEAALARAGGALRPGVSPHLAWLRCLVCDGRWDEAAQILDDLPPPGNPYLRRETTAARAMLARHRGDPAVAWAAILPLFPEGPATAPGDLIHQEGLFLQRIAAGLCLDAGDLPGAHAWLTAHDRWLAWSGSVLGQADGQVAWGAFHQAAGNEALARAHLAAALALAATPDQPLVRLSAHRLLGELDIAGRRTAGAEVHLATALALADACEVPFERALILLALAELLAMTGEAGEAASLVVDARRICVGLGAVPALARADALAARLAGHSGRPPSQFGLSPREMDVLRLVADGRSNPEIAEALFISRETARTHVSNIFRKLDVGTRAEAVDQAHRHDLLSPSP